MENKAPIFIVLAILIGIWAYTFFAHSYYSVIENKAEYKVSGTLTVERVIDGDTLIVNGDTVRLIGINAPEPGQDCYIESRDKLEELVLGKSVNVELDVEDKDIYDRDLRYIFLRGENINIMMVGTGYATALNIPPNERYKEEIKEAERDAKANSLGCLWN